VLLEGISGIRIRDPGFAEFPHPFQTEHGPVLTKSIFRAPKQIVVRPTWPNCMNYRGGRPLFEKARTSPATESRRLGVSELSRGPGWPRTGH